MRLVLASASPRRADLLRAAGYSFDTLVVEVDESVRPGEGAHDYVERLAREKNTRAWRSGAGNIAPGAAAQGAAQGAVAQEVVAQNVVAQNVGPSFSSGDDLVILAADTAVVIDDEILGKPQDDEDARRMLRRLSGRDHEVITAVSLRSATAEHVAVEVTTVWFSPLSRDDIEWYVASGEGHDKAGGYAIQGLASRFVPRIDGSYANVVGLPVARVAMLLDRLGWRR